MLNFQILIKRLFSFIVIFPILIVIVSANSLAQSGIWITKEELDKLPQSGPQWKILLSDASADTSNPDVANQDDPTNVRVLAAAILYARTSESQYKNKVVNAIEKLVSKGHPGGRSLAWGRELGAYAISADLVGYRSLAFDQWLFNMTDVWKCSQLNKTLRGMFEQRPNNWGAHAFGSLAAVYAYLGDTKSLNEIRSYWVQGVTGPNPGLSYASDHSWHVDSNNLRWINPLGSKKNGMDIDGIIPDDMRRGGPLAEPPVSTGYMWEGQQGTILAAVILDRAGMPIWDVADAAILRSAYALQVTYANKYGDEFKAGTEDHWILRFLEIFYKVDFNLAVDQGYGAGKNAGYPGIFLNSGHIPPKPTIVPTIKPTVIVTSVPTKSPTPIPPQKPTITPPIKPTQQPTTPPSVTPLPGKVIINLEVEYKSDKRYHFTANVKDAAGKPLSNKSVSLVRSLKNGSPERVIRKAVSDTYGVAKFYRVKSIKSGSLYKVICNNCGEATSNTIFANDFKRN